MANVTYDIAGHAPGQAAWTVLRRTVHAFQTALAGLFQEIAAARQDFLLRRATRGLSRHLLQDVGLDRSAC
jgi:hypothetical protein